MGYKGFIAVSIRGVNRPIDRGNGREWEERISDNAQIRSTSSGVEYNPGSSIAKNPATSASTFITVEDDIQNPQRSREVALRLLLLDIWGGIGIVAGEEMGWGILLMSSLVGRSMRRREG